MYNETQYDTDTVERVWQSLDKRYNQVLKARGENDLEVEHLGIRNRQREDKLLKYFKIDMYDTDLWERGSINSEACFPV